MQLEQMMEQRTQQAFRPGTVPDEVVTEIAESVTGKSGDCREALEISLRTGRRADQEGLDEVTTKALEI